MNAPNPGFPPPPKSGAAMDRIVRLDPRRRWIKRVGLPAGLVILLVMGWLSLPRGLAVNAADADIATVAHGTFLDALIVRSNIVPFSSVVLDATEGGRVEEVPERDGAMVKKGDLLFRLSNPQREQDVLARSADVAQQLANLSNLRAFLAASEASYHREISGLEYDLTQAKKKHARNVQLASKGFLSRAALDESADSVTQQQQLLEQTRADAKAELTTRGQSIKEMDAAIGGLNNGLRLMRATADGLSVRAPVDGRLTGFQLQVGESVRSGDRLGRVDSPDHFKLTASVDEFYLNRISPGLHASVVLQGRAYAVTVSRLDPQVKEGHFMVEMKFDAGSPAGLQPGESVDAQITLGHPSPALLLPDGAFYADSGGAWVFVVDGDGRHAVRRPVRLGRRAAGRIEVLQGLSAGERVIVSGYRGYGKAQRLRLER